MLLFVVLTKFKLILGLLKVLKLNFLLPVLQTGGTMALSIVVYAQVFGWWFAVGFVVSILVHEMGHVYAAYRLRIPVSAPLFIPGMGALILQKKEARSAWDQALIGIGGPVAGTLAGLVLLAGYHVTGLPLLMALAYTTFFLNLFNLAPIVPLDGGWITGAISPRIWLVGVVVLVGLFFSGVLRNPFLLLIVVISLPRLWHGLRHGDATPPGGVPVEPHQRSQMAAAYLGLCGLLLWLMMETHVTF
jgi:Zn-dependent protease